jgi:hypothetical protein
MLNLLKKTTTYPGLEFGTFGVAVSMSTHHWLEFTISKMNGVSPVKPNLINIISYVRYRSSKIRLKD